MKISKLNTNLSIKEKNEFKNFDKSFNTFMAIEDNSNNMLTVENLEENIKNKEKYLTIIKRHERDARIKELKNTMKNNEVFESLNEISQEIYFPKIKISTQFTINEQNDQAIIKKKKDIFYELVKKFKRGEKIELEYFENLSKQEIEISKESLKLQNLQNIQLKIMQHKRKMKEIEIINENDIKPLSNVFRKNSNKFVRSASPHKRSSILINTIPVPILTKRKTAKLTEFNENLKKMREKSLENLKKKQIKLINKMTPILQKEDLSQLKTDLNIILEKMRKN